MRIVALQSSPNRDGLTAGLAAAALRGAASLGTETELIHLNDHPVNLCRACGDGWGQCRRKEDCIQKDEDDFYALREKLIAADGVIFATPVYFWDLSESARTFLDRLRRSEWPRRQESAFYGKPFIGIAAAGGSGTGSPRAVKCLEDYLNWIPFSPVAFLPVSRQNKDLQLAAAERAGQFMAEQLRGRPR
ncbi:MAG TPA: flavodoxin family protein [Bacillota bacterium]